MPKQSKPLVLLIIDGFGDRKEMEHNAIAHANTPNWDHLQASCHKTLLSCSGSAVGLPDNQMGNSEVGHMHIGAGRFVPQVLTRINRAVSDKSFFSNTVLCDAVDSVLGDDSKNDSALHIMGLLSSGGVHSHVDHIVAMIKLAAQKGLTNIYLHVFLDGRDVPPKSAGDDIARIEAEFEKLGCGRIASMAGRFYAMDRDSRWDRVQRAYNMLVHGKTNDHEVESALQGLEQSYARGETDEFVRCTTILDESGKPTVIKPDDTVVFMNYRADRARELSQAMTEPLFSVFDREAPVHSGKFVTLTEYDKDFTYPVAFPSLPLENGLGEIFAKQGLKQLRLAETEKYAHVTFFMNGGIEEPFENEDRVLVPSPKIRTYDLQPEMSAPEVTDELVKAISSQYHDVIICNYANCDMVGHTGKWEPAIQAVEAIDVALQRIVEALECVNGQMLMTADHGNIEHMNNADTRQPLTSHTTNLVPLLHYSPKSDKTKAGLTEGGSLSDIAPTLLDLLKIRQPAEMTGKSLFRYNT